MKKKENSTGAGRREKSTWQDMVLAIVTCINLLLSLLIAIFHRQEVLKAVTSDDGLKVVLSTKNETKEM